MLATKVACPKCQAALKTSKPLPVGQKVKCPKCGAAFQVTANEAKPAPAALPADFSFPTPAPRKDLRPDAYQPDNPFAFDQPPVPTASPAPSLSSPRPALPLPSARPGQRNPAVVLTLVLVGVVLF